MKVEKTSWLDAMMKKQLMGFLQKWDLTVIAG